MKITSLIAQQSLLSVMNGMGRLALDVLFPPECPSCRGPVETMHNLCPTCFSALRMIAPPFCHACGIPFAVPVDVQSLCPDCLEKPPAFTRARSAMVYDRISAPLISTLKFHDQWAGLERYAALLNAAGGSLLEAADILAPVPLHWRRLWRRKYNQSALLAYGISRHCALPCLPELLVRTRYTPPQMGLKRQERAKNVRRAFAINPAYATRVQGMHVVLVDDVMTTGATANACANVLRKAGAREVSVLTLARTVKE